MADDFMPGFAPEDIVTSAGHAIHCVHAGHGPPVLLLHGHPQTHVTWREKARDVRGQPIDCGHALQEEAPDATLAALLPFLTETTR